MNDNPIEKRSLVSLEEVRSKFENVTYEFEVAVEVTIPVTLSIYRGQKNDGSIPPLYCHIQFEGEGFTANLLDERGDTIEANTLEDVSEAFNIPIDSPIWEVIIDEE